MILGGSDDDTIRSPVLLNSKFSACCEGVGLSPFLSFDLDDNPVVSRSDGEFSMDETAMGDVCSLICGDNAIGIEGGVKISLGIVVRTRAVGCGGGVDPWYIHPSVSCCGG